MSLKSASTPQSRMRTLMIITAAALEGHGCAGPCAGCGILGWLAVPGSDLFSLLGAPAVLQRWNCD